MSDSTTKIAETPTATITAEGAIVYVRIKEGAELTVTSLQAQIDARRKLIDDHDFVVIVDGRTRFTSTKESREFIARFEEEQWVATALVTSSLAVRLVGNFFIQFNRPARPTRLFSTEKDARVWAKSLLALQPH